MLGLLGVLGVSVEYPEYSWLEVLSLLALWSYPSCKSAFSPEQPFTADENMLTYRRGGGLFARGSDKQTPCTIQGNRHSESGIWRKGNLSILFMPLSEGRIWNAFSSEVGLDNNAAFESRSRVHAKLGTGGRYTFILHTYRSRVA